MDKAELLKKLGEWKTDLMKQLTDSGAVVESKLKEYDNTLETKIRDYVERAMQKHVVLGMQPNDIKKFNVGAMTKAIYTNDWSEAEYEKDVLDQTRKRSANAGSGVAGAILIPVEVSNDIIQLAMPDIAMMQMGVTQYNNLQGELLIPKITGRHTIYWVGEEEAPTESNMTFGEITLRMKTAAAFTKISSRLLKQSAGVIDQIVRQELGNAFAIGLDDAMLNGAGGEKKIRGLYGYSAQFTPNNIVPVDGQGATTAGGRFTVFNAGQMVKVIENANMLKKGAGSYGFLMHPDTKWGMKLERVAEFSGQINGEYAFNPLIDDAMLEKMIGYKIRSTTQVPKNQTSGNTSTGAPVVFGDFSQIKVGFWGGMEMRFSDVAGNSSGSAMLNRQLWITANQDLDMNIGDGTGLTMVTGCQTDESKWGNS